MVLLDGLIQCECGSIIWRVSYNLQFHCELCDKNYYANVTTSEDDDITEINDMIVT